MVAMAGSAACSPVTGLRRCIRASSSAVTSHPPEEPKTSPRLADAAPRGADSGEGEAVEESEAAADVGEEIWREDRPVGGGDSLLAWWRRRRRV